MSDYLTPLDVCMTLFGGRAAVETIAGSRPKGSYAWAKPSITRKAGDLPPLVQRKMLRAARKRRIEIEAEWLIEGVSRSRFEAFLDGHPPSTVAAE